MFYGGYLAPGRTLQGTIIDIGAGNGRSSRVLSAGDLSLRLSKLQLTRGLFIVLANQLKAIRPIRCDLRVVAGEYGLRSDAGPRGRKAAAP